MDALRPPGARYIRYQPSKPTWSGALNHALYPPSGVTNWSSGPNTKPRTAECGPSAPTTRSARSLVLSERETSTPSLSWFSAEIRVPKRYSTVSRVA